MLINAYDFGGSANREYNIFNDRVRKVSSKYKRLEPISPKFPVRTDIEVRTDDFIIEKCPWSAISGQRFAKPGAFSMHKGAVEGTDNQAIKSKQDGTYVNACYMIATSILKRMKKPTSYETLPDGKPLRVYLEEDVRVGVCIPSGEYYSPVGADSIKKGLTGSYRVYFPVLRKVVEFKLNKSNITVSPEGVVAQYSFFGTKEETTVRSSTLLVLDAGYRSLDVTILDKYSVDGGSSRSFPIGGITLEALVSSEFERAEMFCSLEDAVAAIETGYIMVSGVKTPVGSYVQAAKKILARRIHDSAIQVLNTTGKFKQNISFIAPVGRCFDVIGKDGDSHYTGDLISDIKDIWGTKVSALRLSNNEEGNVRGLSLGLKRKYRAYLEAAAAAEQQDVDSDIDDDEDDLD